MTPAIATPAAASPTAPPVLRVSGVSKRFADRAVLDNVDLQLAAGERVALLGESGSGKSTLLNVIAGLERCDSGHIEIAGDTVDAADADGCARLRRRHVGFVFQAFHLLPFLDALDNVALPLLLQHTDRDEALQRSRDALQRIGLAARMSARPAELSGGEQQRVALVRALIHRPSLVLADEPTGNLDPHSAAAVARMLTEQIAGSGAALLLVTHSEQTAAIAHRRLWLDDGRLRVQPPASQTRPT